MQINYLIIAHHRPLQLRKLIKTLHTNEVHFFIHIDKKSNLSEFQEVLNSVEFSNITFCKRQVNVIWADYSQVEATLELMNEVVSAKRSGYNVLLSGVDFPLRSNEYISSFFTKNYGINYISTVSMHAEKNRSKHPWRALQHCFHPYPTERTSIFIPSIFERSFYKRSTISKLKELLHSPDRNKIFRLMTKKNVPPYISLFGGSNWWALPIETVSYVLEFINKHPDYIEFMKYTHCTDEMFFQCIIASKLELSSIRESLTYANWNRQRGNPPITFVNSDFSELEAASKSHLFARKFNMDDDVVILNKIDELINSSHQSI